MDLSSLFATLGAVAAGARLPNASPAALQRSCTSESRWGRRSALAALLASLSACGTDLVIEFRDGGVGGGGSGGSSGAAGSPGLGGFAGSGAAAGAGGLSGAGGTPAQAGSGGAGMPDASVPADAGDASPDAAL